jgi:hypothetical protein
MTSYNQPVDTSKDKFYTLMSLIILTDYLTDAFTVQFDESSFALPPISYILL